MLAAEAVNKAQHISCVLRESERRNGNVRKVRE